MKVDYWQKFKEGCFYHVYNRSINKEVMFRSENNYNFFLKRWRDYLGPYVDTYSFALVPNHFHFTIRINKPDEAYMNAVKLENTQAARKFEQGEIPLYEFLEDQMKRFLSSYSKAFNAQNNREGSLMQKRFKRVCLKDEFHIAYMIAYHHHNPLHHGMVKDYQNWKYTSFNAIMETKPTRLVRDAILQIYFNGDLVRAKEEFIRYHDEFKYDDNLTSLCLEDD
jgi:putative transposase